MPGQTYGGLPSQITNPTAVNISQATAANPIQVTTSSSHGLTTGDWVDIFGSANVNANCVNTPVTVIDATNFTIPINGTGAVNGGATGTVQQLAYTQNIATIPADGDSNAAATYVPGYQAVLDRSAFQRANTGQYKLPQFQETDAADTTFNVVAYSAGQAFTANTYVNPTTVNGPGPTYTFTNVSTSDVLEVQYNITVSCSNSVGGTPLCKVKLQYARGAGAYQDISGAAYHFSIPGAVVMNVPMAFSFMLGGPATNNPISFAGPPVHTVDSISMRVQVAISVSQTETISVFKEQYLCVRQWRQVSILQ